ncbi:hypothetical protein [Amycolatopsis sp. NPDC001319]|uniref:hypothetical protein n=1 Tax=unclassified Amycolatopsis TaxID=2618356 RepID=UPI0036C56425
MNPNIVQSLADSPNAADWMSAWGAILSALIAIAALAAAIKAVKAANNTNKIQASQLASLQEDQRRSHAAQFGSWLHGISGSRPQVWVVNSGNQPIRHITVRFLLETSLDRTFFFTSASPGINGFNLKGSQAAQELMEQELHIEFGEQLTEKDRLGDEQFRPEVQRRIVTLYETMTLDVAFRDASGNKWTRYDDGRLEEGYPEWAIFPVRLGGTVEVVRQKPDLSNAK